MKNISILTLSLALSMGLANAAIVLQDDAVFMDGGKDTLTDAEIGGLDVTSGDKLVVTIGLEGDDSGPDSTVTYNGQNMTLAVENTPLLGLVGLECITLMTSVLLERVLLTSPTGDTPLGFHLWCCPVPLRV